MSETTEKWGPFTVTQLVITNPSGFDWDANIAMARRLPVFVPDSYCNAAGLLHVEVLGLIPIQQPPSPKPCGTRPSSPAPTCRRKPSMKTATLPFQSEPADGLIDKVTAAARSPIANGVVSSAPSECLLGKHERHEGLQVPAEGEVAWLLPAQPHQERRDEGPIGTIARSPLRTHLGPVSDPLLAFVGGC